VARAVADAWTDAASSFSPGVKYRRVGHRPPDHARAGGDARMPAAVLAAARLSSSAGVTGRLGPFAPVARATGAAAFRRRGRPCAANRRPSFRRRRSIVFWLGAGDPPDRGGGIPPAAHRRARVFVCFREPPGLARPRVSVEIVVRAGVLALLPSPAECCGARNRLLGGRLVNRPGENLRCRGKRAAGYAFPFVFSAEATGRCAAARSPGRIASSGWRTGRPLSTSRGRRLDGPGEARHPEENPSTGQ
jgi:hypothetical protein